MDITPSRTRLAALAAVCGLALGLNAQVATAQPDEGWRLEQPLDNAVNRIYNDVAATGGDNAWAVGMKSDAGGTGAEIALTHYDGKAWTDVAPAPVTGPARLDVVAAAAPDDVWAAGSASGVAAADVRAHRATPSGSGGASVVQHWDGKAWRAVERPTPAPGWQSFVSDIAVFGGNSVWLTGFDFQESTSSYEYRLEKWDGKAWQQVALPPGPGGKAPTPWAVVGTGPDDITVSAEVTEGKKATPLLYHWDGRVWTVQEVPVPSDYPTGWIANRIAADPKGGVYAVGRQNEWNPTQDPGFVAHWDGKQWTSLPASPFTEANATTVDNDGRLWTAGWADGKPHIQFAVWTGKEWQKDELPAEGTSRSEQSSVLAMTPVPGTKKLLAAGLFSSNDLNNTWGMLAATGA